LLRLEDERAVPFERGASLEVFLRNRLAAPRVHHGAPGRVRAETRQRPPCHRDEKYGENGDRTASPALLAFAGEKRQRDEKRDADGRRDQQERSFGRGRQIREDGVEPPEEEVWFRRGLDDRAGRLTNAMRRPGTTQTWRAKNRDSVAPAMIGPPRSRSTMAWPMNGTRLEIDAPMPSPQYASWSNRSTCPVNAMPSVRSRSRTPA